MLFNQSFPALAAQLDESALEAQFQAPGSSESDQAMAAFRTEKPRVVSLYRANVQNLTIADADLRACRFAGAHHLDLLRTERCTFASTPRGWWVSQWQPVVWRWTRREAIAEEHAWRAQRPLYRLSGAHDLRHGRPTEWNPPECRASVDGGESVPSTGEIASIYRSLRKGREDTKDEPGAADLYYGEMEMRRCTSGHEDVRVSLPRGERAVLWLYWMACGYGQRASRALLGLLFTIIFAAAAFKLYVFESDSYWRSLLYSAQSTTSFLRAPTGTRISELGQALEIPLRLLGPLFFGLVLLSLRGRVKR